MRTLFTSLTLLVPTAFILLAACADTDASCEDTLSCQNDTTTGEGSGAGGISIGVPVQGTALALTNTAVTVGTEGLASEGAGESNDGVPGLARPELDLAEL